MATSELTHIMELMAQDNPEGLADLQKRVHYYRVTNEWSITFPVPFWETTHEPGTNPPEIILDLEDAAAIFEA